MAKAYVEIDGLELEVDEYFDFIEQPESDFKPGAESLNALNQKYGFPDKNGAML